MTVQPARGIRINNPMNIRLSSAPWLGKISPSSDPDFEEFDTPEHGIRAGGVLLVNYHQLDGLSTLRGYINRWAPSSENDTDSYLAAVCGSLGCNADDPYNVLDSTLLANLAAAIIHQEQGSMPYTFEVIDSGIAMVLPISATIIPFSTKT
jgi:hypothetical protein